MGAVLRPIPRNLLPDEATVRVPVDGDWGGELSEGRTIGHVRFDDKSALARKGFVLGDDASGLLFVDAVTSEGAFPIPIGSAVSVAGHDMTAIRTVDLKGYDGRTHHWEVELR